MGANRTKPDAEIWPKAVIHLGEGNAPHCAISAIMLMDQGNPGRLGGGFQHQQRNQRRIR
jgi:hypothetical protein